MVVVISKMNRQIKYAAPSNHAAFMPKASHLLILNLSCNSLASGCKPKNAIKGNTSQNFQEVKIVVSMQVAKYANAYPHQLRLDKGNKSAMDASRYAVNNRNSVYTPTVRKTVASAQESAERAISCEVIFRITPKPIAY